MRIPVLVSLFLLSACGGNVREAERAIYDLSSAAIVWKPADLAIAGVSAQGPAWLASPAMSYRLLYAGDMERNAYGESRWAAPPADLIERALNRQTAAGGGGCRLRLEVDELIQVFETPQSSRMLLDTRASLFAPNGEAVLARRAFSVVRPAPTPDARGGVAATSAALQGLGGEMNSWLMEIARTQPAIARRCNSI